MKIFFYGELILFSVDKINGGGGAASVVIDENNWPISNFLIYYRIMQTFRLMEWEKFSFKLLLLSVLVSSHRFA